MRLGLRPSTTGPKAGRGDARGAKREGRAFAKVEERRMGRRRVVDGWESMLGVGLVKEGA